MIRDSLYRIFEKIFQISLNENHFYVLYNDEQLSINK
jgi:hypothetical protein